MSATLVHQHAAAAMLREFTATPSDRGVITLLIRAAVLSPAAAEILVKAALRTRADRAAAVVAAAAALAAEMDGRVARTAA